MAGNSPRGDKVSSNGSEAGRHSPGLSSPSTPLRHGGLIGCRHDPRLGAIPPSGGRGGLASSSPRQGASGLPPPGASTSPQVFDFERGPVPPFHLPTLAEVTSLLPQFSSAPSQAPRPNQPPVADIPPPRSLHRIGRSGLAASRYALPSTRQPLFGQAPSQGLGGLVHASPPAPAVARLAVPSLPPGFAYANPRAQKDALGWPTNESAIVAIGPTIEQSKIQQSLRNRPPPLCIQCSSPYLVRSPGRPFGGGPGATSSPRGPPAAGLSLFGTSPFSQSSPPPTGRRASPYPDFSGPNTSSSYGQVLSSSPPSSQCGPLSPEQQAEYRRDANEARLALHEASARGGEWLKKEISEAMAAGIMERPEERKGEDPYSARGPSHGRRRSRSYGRGVRR
ncbi:hypothetical protein CC78DRAFT_577578 [Lojkania enalia]|uniref:Uncharacterized protein n=1 Tax=Lojkania enalia TaxID=147567 RepID=A0A9P4KFL0_9PLEO|nr:hypothetical protein CC78DRAFT_577578 [Didymosphaeria enalia]